MKKFTKTNRNLNKCGAVKLKRKNEIIRKKPTLYIQQQKYILRFLERSSLINNNN